MKKTCSAIVTVLCVAASASMAQNAVPYQETYEGYAEGSNLVGTVWQGAAGSAIAVVTNGTPTEPTVGYPVPGNHYKVLAFSDGPITNVFDGTTSNLTVVAFDTMIKPVFAEPPSGTQMEAISNSQMSLYIDTNGYVNVFHGIQNNQLPADPNDGWAWTTLTNTTPISSGSWVRVTVVMNYDSVVNGPISMFKVAVNGTFLNSPDAYSEADISKAKDGPWFVSPKWTADLRMHSIILNGSGMMDDTVVSTNEISYSVMVATNGTPIQWMLAQGLTTNVTYPTWNDVALGDEDGDGAPTWAEHIAGTRPNDPTSKLFIISSTISNGLPILKWIGTTNALNPYTIQWSSNLMSISSWINATNLPKVEGTNQVTLPPAVINPAFLRVTVPN